MKRLIVNADDFGHSRSVNKGVSEARERGIVTSASLMVRRDAATDAARYARTHPELSVGLHLDLGEWTYREADGWIALYEVGAAEIEHEVGAQLELFRSLVGRDPTHIDSHQHAHQREPAREAVLSLRDSLGIPVRHFERNVRYLGDFYGQNERGERLPALITARALVSVLRTLPDGITELCCHPARGPVPDSGYDGERARELGALCDPRVRRVIDVLGIDLVSFFEIAR